MADVKALVVRLEADLKDLKAGMAEASGEITKFTKQSDALGGSAMRNWQMANRMGGSFQGVAMSMGGVGTQGRMLFGVLDNMGDYFERTSLRGLSFKDALKNLRGEIGMMASAGAVMAASAIFDAMQKAAQRALDAANQVLGVLERMTADVMDKKFRAVMNAQRELFEKGKLTYNQYHEWLVTRQNQYAAEVSRAQMMAMEAVAVKDKTKKVEQAKAAEAMYQQASKAAAATAQELERLEDQHQDKVAGIRKRAEEKYLKERRDRINQGYDFYKNRISNESELAAEFAAFEMETQDQIDEYRETRAKQSLDRITSYTQTAVNMMAGLMVQALNGEIKSWKDWANSVIREIERVMLKKALLAGIGSIFGGAGGVLGGIVGGIFGSPGGAGVQPSIQIITADLGTIVRVTNKAYGSATPGAQAQLSQVVARGNLVNTKR